MEQTIRILTYNVRSLRDDRAALARVVRSCAPDVVCIQESPRFFGWRRAARAMAASFGLRVVIGGANASGNLLLAGPDVKVDAAEVLYLKHRRGYHLRGLALATLRIGNSRFTVGGTHLSMNLEQRVYQAGEVLGHLDGFAERNQTKSRILAGDFNSYPGSVEWNIITERLADAWMVSPVGAEFTSTGKNPYQRLDAVFVSRDVYVVRAGVPTDLVSQADTALATDHLPVLAVVRI
ncbi:endonuclease/exonuclease/phosphatase family protein [Catenulispora sp. NF23]|uniref:endonuclease/exonuclease/phosphatase family protein n=2 Tax=Catenulispora TaxID=414878 RepID=UPI001BACAAD7|nr:endonuclease/exonuclease/phosphatase family protein [Catenulispora pinistramenti]MBS2534240.1 endonuclease/exonuclease/phosphatase family protein [Catenulispora pinistramenti]